MSLTPAQFKLFDDCQILQVEKIMRMKKNWRDGGTWIEFHKRRIRVARAYIYWNTTGFLSDNMLAKYWSWCGHVGRMCSSRQALLSNWCSLQWKREGLASWRNKPVYDHAHQWKIRGAGTSHELLWESALMIIAASKIWENGDNLHKIGNLGSNCNMDLCWQAL